MEKNWQQLYVYLMLYDEIHVPDRIGQQVFDIVKYLIFWSL